MKMGIGMMGLMGLMAAELPPAPELAPVARGPRDVPVGWTVGDSDTNAVRGFGVYWFDAVSFHYQDVGFNPACALQETWLSNAVPPVRIMVATFNTNGISGDGSEWIIWPAVKTNTVVTFTLTSDCSGDLRSWGTTNFSLSVTNPDGALFLRNPRWSVTATNF